MIPTNCKMMEEAITLNNQGLQCLQASMYCPALANLKRAAEHLHRATIEANKDHEGDDESQDGTESFLELHADARFEEYPRLSLEDDGASCYNVPLNKNAIILQSNNESVFIQNQPFFVPHSIPHTRMGLTYVSTLVLYNMGLAYHLSTCQCSAIPNAIECATTLYKMSASLALKHPIHGNMIQLVLASMNNLGCLYFDLGDFDIANRILDDLTGYIVSLGADIGIPLTKRNEFMLNAILLRNPYGARAA